MDEVDDLTRFLDEDFATQDVDLFEFTSEEDSPLTQLKSIILSLDWEITDEILQDLTDEIDNLRHLDLFENDKVSQVYLQGLNKIGLYIQSEGAHAHPNSIKLLLTLYYDFEKILSSEHITGAEITALLKADVRKFKILQHQIAQKHGVTAVTAGEVATTPLPLTEHKDLLGVQAAILELDWEVTDQGLKHLAEQLDILKNKFAEDRYIKIIIQGLHTLNSYIDEERARAHPETFSLLHTFYDALETLVDDGDLDNEKRQEILVDSINRLNNLKNLIAQTYATEDLAPEAISPVTEAEALPEEELSLDAEHEAMGEELVAESMADELDIEMPGPSAVPTEPAPGILDVAEAEDEEDEEYEAPAGEEEGGEIAPALSDSLEEGGFGGTGELEAPPDELEEKLDFFFGSEKEEFEPEAIEEAAAKRAEAEEAAAVEPEPAEAEEEIAPALAGSVEDSGFGAEEAELEAPPEELAEKLESFFGADEEAPTAEAVTPTEVTTEPEGEEEPLAALAAEEDEEPLAALTGEEEVEEVIAPALGDFGEEAGFGAPGTDLEAPPEELAEKLDFFFGGDEEKPPVEEIPAEGPPEEEVLLTPALEEPAPQEAPSFEEPVEAAPSGPASVVTTREEYQAALDKMQASYRELENALREEIATLRQEVETLRARLKE